MAEEMEVPVYLPWQDYVDEEGKKIADMTSYYDIRITSQECDGKNMLESIFNFYKQGTLCDANIVCGDGVSVSCHKLVLAFLSNMLEEALCDIGDDVATVLMPDISSDSLISCLDAVYGNTLNRNNPEKLEVVKEVLDSISSRHSSELFFIKSDTIKNEECDWPGQPVDFDDEVKKPMPKRKYFKSGEGASDKKRPKLAIKQPKSIKHENMQGLFEVFNAMMEDKAGTFAPKIRPSLEDSSPLSAAFASNTCYMALVAISIKSGNHIDACPLAWSHQFVPKDSKMLELLQRCGKTFKNVFGLSDMEFFGEIRGRALVGAPKQYEKLKSYVVRKELAKLESDQLQGLVEEIQSSNAAQRGQVKKNLNTFQEEEEIAFSIVDILSIEQTSGVMLISVNNDEQVVGYPINSPIKPSSNAGRSERDAFCKYLFQLVFRVILLRTGEKQCLNCPELIKHFLHYAVLKKRYDTAQDFLKDENLKQVNAEPPPKISVCEECGESFDISTDHKRYLYQKHKREHSYINFRCDCPVTWTKLIDKMRHINLVHKKGYKKCDHCTFVAQPAAVAKHIQDQHVQVTCEYCGLVMRNRYYLPVHIARHHPQKADEKNLKKFVGGWCKHCGENFKRLEEHIKRVHVNAAKTTFVVCPDCGKGFKKQGLKKHILNVHTPVEQLEFPCHQCPRRFSTNDLLKRHVQSFHEKILKYACKFSGCNMAYSSSASLSNHQRMQHKITYQDAVRKGLLDNYLTGGSQEKV